MLYSLAETKSNTTAASHTDTHCYCKSVHRVDSPDGTDFNNHHFYFQPLAPGELRKTPHLFFCLFISSSVFENFFFFFGFVLNLLEWFLGYMFTYQAMLLFWHSTKYSPCTFWLVSHTCTKSPGSILAFIYGSSWLGQHCLFICLFVFHIIMMSINMHKSSVIQ